MSGGIVIVTLLNLQARDLKLKRAGVIIVCLYRGRLSTQQKVIRFQSKRFLLLPKQEVMSLLSRDLAQKLDQQLQVSTLHSL